MSKSEKQEDSGLFSRVFNPWRYALNQNSQLLVSEVIDKFIKIETTVPLCGPCKYLIITTILLWLQPINSSQTDNTPQHNYFF